MQATILKAVLCCLAASALAQAQEARDQKLHGKAPQKQERKQGPETQEPGIGFIRTEFRFGGKVIKNAPYSAEALTESTQVLANGTKLSQKTTALVYRDGEGRTRREQSAAPVGPFATSGEAPRVVFISDPVAGLAYTLYPETRTAIKTVLPPTEIINAADPKAAPPPPGQGALRPPPHNDDKGQTVSLGKRVIEGMNSDGERTTLTIPVDGIGNDQPIEIVEERWKSPDLRTTLWSKTSDPRWGETTYHLTKIIRGEPDHSLFVVPNNYTIQEDKPQDGRRKGRERRPTAIQ